MKKTKHATDVAVAAVIDHEIGKGTIADLPHEHCVYMEALHQDVEELKREMYIYRAKEEQLLHCLEEEKGRRDFCLDRFKGNHRKIRYYTGFVTFGLFEACFNYLSPSTMKMRT